MSKMIATASWDPFSGRTIDRTGLHIDLVEGEKYFTITVNVPGVSKDDIRIIQKGNSLYFTVNFPRKKANERIHVNERYCGPCERRVTFLPDTANFENIKANVSNGVLSLNVLKLVKNTHL